ncbi:MAG: hypothetical protein JWL90_1703, partial [Chthoniobacteraceae bacterium]|nr:hypothetical protein [Chthoniobacteraceae bacterium]
CRAAIIARASLLIRGVPGNSPRIHRNRRKARAHWTCNARRMIQRFSRSFPGFTSAIAKKCGNEPEWQCCALIQRTRELALFDPLPEWCSPLTPGMQLVNISHSEDGRHLRVNLGTDWARMFEHLVVAKAGLLMTRNAVAILERRMKYPALSVTSGGGKGASGHGGLWVNFGRLDAARAVHMREKTGHLFGVEFANAAGQIVHRFTLTKESDMDEFFAWARLHQACAAHPAASWLEETEEEIISQEATRTLWCCGSGAW